MAVIPPLFTAKIHGPFGKWFHHFCAKVFPVYRNCSFSDVKATSGVEYLSFDTYLWTGATSEENRTETAEPNTSHFPSGRAQIQGVCNHNKYKRFPATVRSKRSLPHNESFANLDGNFPQNFSSFCSS